ncbi:hypothetical protein EZS27_010864 [termite gut metagenome]|uniref:DUF1460 domain-containing protein n=1 Tax=termite gut metagenome TaxID=433724 RepID=A0A5J4S5H7_9ZZZZ
MKIAFALLWGAFSTIALSIVEKEGNPMLKNGLGFLEVPYVAQTLEGGEKETLVVNLHQVDCTTFVEYVLAMSLCPSQGEDMQKEDFIKNLRHIRYRDGEINGYPSRLHYFSDWINDNVRMGIIEDVTAAHSSTTTHLSLSYMSTHPELYEQLKNFPENVAVMFGYEKALSGQTVHWTPKEEIPAEGFSWIKDGDIIAITTTIPGLDISHVGIAIYVMGELHLLHASLSKGKVIVEEVPLNQQLSKNKNMLGVRVLRMRKK